MARVPSIPLQTFNRGRISQLALARTDIDRIRISAETQTNWMPRELGSMMLRPGLGYLGEVRDSTSVRMTSFFFGSTDKALVELSSGAMRLWIDDEVVQRETGSTASITNGDFSSSGLTGWTDNDGTGAISSWSSGQLAMIGTGFVRARRNQLVSASSGDHSILVSVTQGRPRIRVGSNTGLQEYISETTLRPGNYSLKFTSTGDFSIELNSYTPYTSLIDSISVESSGAFTVPTTWHASELDGLRFDQDGNTIYVASEGGRPKRIDRLGPTSWGVVNYDPQDGPFKSINVTGNTLTPSAITGDITLTASQNVFESSHVGTYFEITSVGQKVEASFSAGDQNSDSIRVSGVTETRIFDILISDADSSSPIYIQRSIGEEGSWIDITALQYSSTTDTTHDDGLDNQIAFYRMATPSTFSGTASGELNYAGGGITGRCMITGVSTNTESSAIVVKAMGSTTGSVLWSEGAWGDVSGYPSGVALHEGRLLWAGLKTLWGSAPEGFETFDSEIEGDSAPINVNIGGGANDRVLFLKSLTRLVMGMPTSIRQAKTSSLEESLTPTNFSVRDVETIGSAAVDAVKYGQSLFIVAAGGTRVYEVTARENTLDFEVINRTQLVPEIGDPSIVRLAIQRRPDTRIHCIRSDGTVAVLLFDPRENIVCWVDIETDGSVEDAVIQSSGAEDAVYYVVQRTVLGVTKRYLERWATEAQAAGGQDNRIADSYVTRFPSGSTLVDVPHLKGETVVVWTDTQDRGEHTVGSTGDLSVANPGSIVVVGLPYSATFKSAKLAYAADIGSPLTQRKRIDQVGIIAVNMHSQGLQYGPSTSVLMNMPLVERMQAVSTDLIWTDYDSDPITFPGKWDTDSRLVLIGQAPRPVTLLGAIIGLQTEIKT